MNDILYIAHRVNTIEELDALDVKYGVEIDLRDFGDKIVLVHDPFITREQDYVEFEEYLRHFRHAFIILNVKSERIELRIIELLKTHGVTNYFFLDSSFPMIVKLSKMGEHRIAIRYSEYEPLEAVLAVRGMAEWVWVDCFNKYPLTMETSQLLKEAGFKICLVSPELQGHGLEMIQELMGIGGSDDIDGEKILSDKILSDKILFDAICCKNYNIRKIQGLI